MLVKVAALFLGVFDSGGNDAGVGGLIHGSEDEGRVRRCILDKSRLVIPSQSWNLRTDISP